MTTTRDLSGIITGAATPALFDNDTSLATTGFVQRALGNFRGIVALTGATTLNETHIGKFISCGIGPYTVTLPAASSGTIGSTLTFVATSNSIAISRAGSDNLLFGNGSSGTSITLNAGDTVTITWASPTSWTLAGGSAQLKYSNNFGASILSNGYQKLPSGLILQWGTFVTDGAGASTVTLPIAFPNNNTAATGNVAAVGIQNTVIAINRTLSTLSIHACSGASGTGQAIAGTWIAIGY